MGMAVGDFNADGRQDLIVINTRGAHRLLLNTTTDTGNWLTVRLLETDSNPGAIGARLDLDVAGETLIRVLHAGDGYNGQNTYRVHFGLGNALQADALRVRWPDGRWETFGALTANGRYQIQDGEVVTNTETLQPVARGLEVWPNPSQGAVTIRSDGGTLVVRDMLGRIVQTFLVTAGTQQLDLDGLPAGVYAVEVISSTGADRSLFLRR